MSHCKNDPIQITSTRYFVFPNVGARLDGLISSVATMPSSKVNSGPSP